MQARTVRDLGAVVREARTRRGMTQAALAHEVGASRDWVVRLEKGHPRLEAQLVLDALAACGVLLTTSIDDEAPPAAAEEFGGLLDHLTERGASWPNAD